MESDNKYLQEALDWIDIRYHPAFEKFMAENIAQPANDNVPKNILDL